MSNEIKPLSPAEVDALELLGSSLREGSCRWLATVRDRERIADSLTAMYNEIRAALREALSDADNITFSRTLEKVWHLRAERDDLQRRLDSQIARADEHEGYYNKLSSEVYRIAGDGDYHHVYDALGKIEQKCEELERRLAEAREDTDRLSEAVVIGLRTIKRNSSPEQKAWSVNKMKELMKREAIDAAKEAK